MNIKNISESTTVRMRRDNFNKLGELRRQIAAHVNQDVNIDDVLYCLFDQFHIDGVDFDDKSPKERL